MNGGRDPVERAADDEDLQEVATWEPRTRLDRFAHGFAERIVPAARGVVVLAALAFTAAILLVSAFGTPRLPIVALFVLASVVPALALAAYVYAIDVTTREPSELLLATFALSFVFASFAAIVNTATQNVLFGVGAVGIVAYYLFVVAPGEELVKLLAVRFYAYRDGRFDAVIDGAVYGAVAGLGFATIENAIYVSGFLQTATTGTVIEQAVEIVQKRALAGPGHVIYSAIAGYYLGLAKFNEEYGGALVVKGITIAAAIHAIYNLSVSFAPALIGDLLGVGQLVGFVVFVVAFDGLAGGFLLVKLQRYRHAYDRVDAGGTYDPSTPVDRTEFDAPTRDGAVADGDDAASERADTGGGDGTAFEDATTSEKQWGDDGDDGQSW